MRVAVGSGNPVKVAAVEDTVSSYFDDVTVESVAVDSGVSEMPTDFEEASTGATNRAKRAMQQAGADIGIGPEGFVTELDAGMFLSNWVVVVNQNGKTGHGGGTILELPDAIADRIRNGEELGPVIDNIVGREDISKEEGTIGILTNGYYTRQDAFEDAITCALAPFLRKDTYRGEQK